MTFQSNVAVKNEDQLNTKLKLLHAVSTEYSNKVVIIESQPHVMIAHNLDMFKQNVNIKFGFVLHRYSFDVWYVFTISWMSRDRSCITKILLYAKNAESCEKFIQSEFCSFLKTQMNFLLDKAIQVLLILLPRLRSKTKSICKCNVHNFVGIYAHL